MIPSGPGVYFFFSGEGRLLYIGKSSNLRRRISDHRRSWAFLRKRSWLRGEKPSLFTFVLTLSSLEASQLEFQLIKEWMPLYNVKDNDEEEPQVISLNLKEAFPALELKKTREDTDREVWYIGPLVFLKRIYPLYQFLLSKYRLRRCKDKDFSRGSKGCIYFQIKRCLGPCFQGERIGALYWEIVSEIQEVFKGRVKRLREELKSLLKESIKSLDFESAENQLRLIKSLKYLSVKQSVILPIAKSFSVAESTSFDRDELTIVLRYHRGLLTSFDITLGRVEKGETVEESCPDLVPVGRIKNLLRLNLRTFKSVLSKYNKREVSHVRTAGNFYQRFFNE